MLLCFVVFVVAVYVLTRALVARLESGSSKSLSARVQDQPGSLKIPNEALMLFICSLLLPYIYISVTRRGKPHSPVQELYTMA